MRSGVRGRQWFLPGLILVLGLSELAAQDSGPLRDSTVRIDIVEPIEPASEFSFLNSLHAQTDRRLVTRLVHRTLEPGDSLTSRQIDELRRNLRELGIFRHVTMLSTAADPRLHPDSIHLVDAWSLIAAPVLHGDDERTGLMLVERNLAGQAIRLGLGMDVSRGEGEDRRYFFLLRDPELLAIPLLLEVTGTLSGRSTAFDLRAERNHYTDNLPWIGGVRVRYEGGEEVLRLGDPARIDQAIADTIEGSRTRGSAWFGLSDNDEDLFVGSAALHVHRRTVASGTGVPTAFENTVGPFLGIASIGREYRLFPGFEATGPRYAPVGGMGRVSIGTFVDVGSGDEAEADDLLYFGAEARQSIAGTDWFAHVSVEAGTGLRSKEAERTLLRVGASTGIGVGPGTVAARSELRVVWRWPRYISSSANGDGRLLRGYGPTDLFGDNYLVGNLEYRFDPVVRFGGTTLAPVIFHDIAGFWNRGQEFAATRFHNSVGAGIRLGHATGVSRPALRIDVAYNLDTGAIGGLSIGISEAFDIFGFLGFLPAGPYLPE